MKKVLFITLSLILLLCIANVSYADYGIPGIIEYDAKIVNENGAKSSDGSTLIPYGTTVHIIYEVDGYATIEYNGKSVSINFEDIKPISDEVDMSKSNKSQKNMYVYREGAYLYKGPSITYGKVDNDVQIPKGTCVKIEASTDMWGYVEYNGTKGWVYIYTSDAISPYNMICSLTDIANKNTAHYFTLKEISLSSTVDGKNIIGTIPAGEHIDYYFWSQYPDPHGKTVYIKYNDLEGWYLENEEEVYADTSNENVNVYIYKSLDIYSDVELTNKVATIPEKTECKLIYNTCSPYENSYYIEYNGVKGWTNECIIDEDSYVRL